MERMRTLYREVAGQLEQVEFHRLWPGFRPYPFALYTEETVWLAERTLPRGEAFRGNTAISFQGSPLAIWQIETGTEPDPVGLAADLVHEMFHAFQMEQGEARFPDDLAALDDSPDAAAISHKLAENRLLAQVLLAGDQGEAHSCLEVLCTLRERRLGGQMAYELLAETVEGTAEYVGTQALAQLDSQRYRQRLEVLVRRLGEASPLLLDVRRLAYCTGTALLLAAEKAGLDLRHQLAGETRPIYTLLRERVADREAPEVPADPAVEALLRDQRRERQEILRQFFRRAAQPEAGDFVICGYDPMNLFPCGKLLYGSHFWLLQNRETGEQITLTGEAVLVRTGVRQVSRYWRAQP